MGTGARDQHVLGYDGQPVECTASMVIRPISMHEPIIGHGDCNKSPYARNISNTHCPTQMWPRYPTEMNHPQSAFVRQELLTSHLGAPGSHQECPVLRDE